MPHDIDRLAGLKVLLVEDEWFIADDLAGALAAKGAQVIGPASSLDDAMQLVSISPVIDAAVLDVSLHGEMSYPVADALTARGVPFVFSTGYNEAMLPPRYAGIAYCGKPFSPIRILEDLLG